MKSIKNNVMVQELLTSYKLHSTVVM